MFRRPIVLAILLFSTNLASAQFKMGAVVGTNLNTMNVINDSENGPTLFNFEGRRFGFHIGLTSQIAISSKVVLAPELKFTTRHYTDKKSDPSGLTPSFKISFSQQFIEIPILLKFSVINRLSILGGTSLNFKLSQASDSESSLLVYDNVLDKNLELQGVLGLSYLILPNFEMRTQFNFGITDLGYYMNGITDERTKFKDNAILASIAYYIIKD